MPRLDLLVVSDAICPWCWIGKRRLEQGLDLLRQSDPGLDFAIRFHPFELNPDMPPEGRDRRTYRIAKFGSEEASRARDAEVAAAGAESGPELHFERITRTPSTVNAHRLARFAAEADAAAGLAVIEGLFQAYFRDGLDIASPALLADIGAAAGLARGPLLARLETDEAVEEVRAEAAGVAMAGISGVPTFALNRYVLFSGAMPADLVADALGRAARHPQIIAAGEAPAAAE